jgi:hypothetical protein
VSKSTDGGMRWSEVNRGLAAGSDVAVRTLAVDPHVPGTVYAGAENRGVFKSTDGGMT